MLTVCCRLALRLGLVLQLQLVMLLLLQLPQLGLQLGRFPLAGRQLRPQLRHLQLPRLPGPVLPLPFRRPLRLPPAKHNANMYTPTPCGNRCLLPLLRTVGGVFRQTRAQLYTLLGYVRFCT